MEAKDTVMGLNSGLVQALYLKSQQIKALLEAQAEISFKAGRESVLSEAKSGDISVNDLILAAKREGRREVVEWIDESGILVGGCGWDEWQAKLKEWGIEL